MTLALCLFTLWALDSQRPPVFQAEARLVVVYATVRDSRGAMITNLDRSAFSVYENGKRQPLSLFLGENTPVSLGIVIDNSGSMRNRRTKVEAAALALARASNRLDEVFVVNFADRPQIDVAMTNDLSELEAGIARVDSIGGTAMRDAVELAARYLTDHARHDRKVLVLITDGIDNASAAPAERIRKLAAQSDVGIYALALPHDDPQRTERARHDLDDLTEFTGGISLHVDTMDNVDSVAVQLASQIRHQYTLAYTPLNQALDGSYRKIRVAVRGPGELSVRTRAGYFATGKGTR
jgi:Ca-activated chloride channel homolog